jgi:K+-transporting ATPase KdpF subunit
MNVEIILGISGVCAVILLIYLFYVLFRGEEL